MPLAAAIAELRRALEAKDGLETERAMADAARAIMAGERPTGALATEWAACERLAQAYLMELSHELHGTATTARAVRAYEDSEMSR